MTKRYEGRPLHRPTEEVVDQGLAFDVGTLLGRRVVLRALGLGAVTAGLTACGAGAAGSSGATTASAGATTTATAVGTALAEIPDETAGPYPGDGSNGPDVLTESGVVRSDLRTSFGTGSATAEGVPMRLTLSIKDLTNGGAPFAGVAVYVWHCDREGRYSLYSSGVENENYLRGVQVADAAGQVGFTSVFPACYTGRWPHVHFEVYPDGTGFADADPIATSQVALPQAVADVVYAQPGYEASVANLAQLTLDSDNVFGDDGGAQQLATVTGDATNGYDVALTVGVDTTTTPAAGGAGPAGSDGAPPGAPSGGARPSGPPPSGPRPSGPPPSGSPG